MQSEDKPSVIEKGEATAKIMDERNKKHEEAVAEREKAQDIEDLSGRSGSGEQPKTSKEAKEGQIQQEIYDAIHRFER